MLIKLLTFALVGIAFAYGKTIQNLNSERVVSTVNLLQFLESVNYQNATTRSQQSVTHDASSYKSNATLQELINVNGDAILQTIKDSFKIFKGFKLKFDELREKNSSIESYRQAFIEYAELNRIEICLLQVNTSNHYNIIKNAIDPSRFDYVSLGKFLNSVDYNICLRSKKNETADANDKGIVRGLININGDDIMKLLVTISVIENRYESKVTELKQKKLSSEQYNRAVAELVDTRNEQQRPYIKKIDQHVNTIKKAIEGAKKN